MKLFSNHREALLVERPNRFLMKAELVDSDGEATGEIVSCHCPNPGRLLEFLIPGTRLILEDRTLLDGRPRTGSTAAAPAKTRWTAVALYHRNSVVPVYAARANAAARDLVIPRIIPDIAELRAEYAIGRSRFDFLATDSLGKRHLIEVKSCSLVEAGAAMFPDAPSVRAVKHLQELAELKGEGYEPHVAFVIAHGDPDFFAPNVHTDPLFAKTLAFLAPRLSIHAALVHTDSQGECRFVRADIPVNLSACSLGDGDRGNFLAVFDTAGGEGERAGAESLSSPRWHVCAGYRESGLASYLVRLERKTGKPVQKTQGPQSTVDILAARSRKIITLPIFSDEDRTSELAAALSSIGCHDTALYPDHDLQRSFIVQFELPPMKTRSFLDLLFHFRAKSFREYYRK